MNLDINEISNTKFEFLSNTCTTVENQFTIKIERIKMK